jgi:PAS domain S-box-containing protein
MPNYYLFVKKSTTHIGFAFCIAFIVMAMCFFLVPISSLTFRIQCFLLLLSAITFWSIKKEHVRLNQLILGYGFIVPMVLWIKIPDYALIDFNSWNQYGFILLLVPNIIIPSVIYEKRNTSYFINLGMLFLAIVFLPSIAPFFNVNFIASHSEPFSIPFFQLSTAFTFFAVAFVLDINKQNLSKYRLDRIKYDENLEQQIAEKTMLLARALEEKHEMYLEASEVSLTLSQLIDSFPSPIWMKDLEGVYVSVNDKLEAYFRKPSAEILGKTDYDLMDKEQADLVRENDKEAIEAGKPIVKIETVFSPESGRDEIFETTKTASYRADGSILGVIGISRNITDKKIAEDELTKSEYKHKNILNITPLGICVFDSSLKLIEINRAFAQLTQYSEDEIIGLLSIYDLDAKLDRKAIDDLYQNVVSDRETTFLETELTKKDGTIFPAAISLIKVGKGAHTMYYGTFSDITERRINESLINEQQKHLLEAQRIANLGSWQVNVQTNQVFWSDEVFRIFGVEPFDVTVADFYAYIHPDESAEVQRHFEKCAAEQTDYQITHRIITKNGDIKWVEENATFRYDTDQNLLIANGTTQDITETVLHKQNLELEVQKMNLALKGGDIMAWEYNINTNQMDVFPSDLESSHTPLANIKSLNDIYKYLHEDSQNQALRRIEKLDDGISNTVVFESQIRDSSTGYRWYSCSVNVLERDKKGKAIKLFGVFQDIESKKNEELIEIRGQEEERVRVSRDIHDSIGQLLVGTRMMVNSSLNKVFEPKELKDFHHEIDDMLDHLIKETRLIINNLGVAIFTNSNLKETLDQFIERMRRLFPGQIEFNWQGKKSLGDSKKELNVFRIFQECLTNAIKHADASKIEIDVLNEDGQFLMQIKDNGKGLEVPEEKYEFGLRNMTERAEFLKGRLLFENNNGTSITLKID